MGGTAAVSCAKVGIGAKTVKALIANKNLQVMSSSFACAGQAYNRSFIKATRDLPEGAPARCWRQGPRGDVSYQVAQGRKARHHSGKDCFARRRPRWIS
jgi:hypothetical protein